MFVTIAGTLLVGITGYCGATDPTNFAISTAANVFGNLATDWLKSICRFGDEAYLANYQRIDKNHVVVRGVRNAQLDALAVILRRFDMARRSHRDDAQDNFAKLLTEFLRHERDNARKLRFDGVPGTSEQETQLRREVIDLLPAATGTALAARQGPAAATTDRDRFRRACDAAVLRELRTLVFEDIPPLFLAAFQGSQGGSQGGSDGWFDLFFRQIAAEIRKGGEFAHIWQAEQQAALVYALAAQAGQLQAIADTVKAIHAAVARQDLEALHAYLDAIRARVLGDAAFPLDFPAAVDIGGALRFAPRNPLVPFFGRGAEIEALRGFLDVDAPQDFRWWLLSGAGGAGKTRLALRLAMLAHAEGWRAGFLPDAFAADPAALDAWQPQQPTLVVVDYTLKRRDAVRVLAERLGRRAGKLPHPVRLLLIERLGGEGFDAQLLAADTQGVIPPHRHADAAIGPEFALPPLTEDDLWALARGGSWNPAPRSLPATRPDFFTRLDHLDEGRRPLVAMILADAVSATPGHAAFFSLADELRSLLARDRLKLWPAALGCREKPIGQTDADTAIAFATMLGGMQKPEFAALEAACGRPLAFDHAACAAALGARFDPHAPLLPKLEPDLIGEFFALEVLDSRDGFHGPRHPRMGEAAWHRRPDRMADFVRRAAQNFPDHPAIPPLQQPVPGIVESWRLRAFGLLLTTGTLDAGLVAAADALRDVAANDLAAATALAEVALAVTGLPDEATQPTLRWSVLKDVAAAAKAHPDEPPLREQWAKAATNYIADRAADEAPACLALLDEMRTLAAAHPDEPPLREQWANAATNYVNRRAVDEARACLALLDEMRILAAAHPDEPPLREIWAKAATNYVNRRAADEAPACLALLDEMRILAAAHPDEPPLREIWASAATNYVNRRAAVEAPACLALLDEMRILAAAHPDEPPLREQWGRGIGAYIHRQRTAGPSETLRLLEAAATVVQDHPAEDELLSWYSIAALLWSKANAATHPEEAKLVLQRMLRLAVGREHIVREAFERLGLNRPGT